MSVLPLDSILGTLTLDQVFVTYDVPRLFTCTNIAGHRYLVVWLDEDETGDSWLYAPISARRWQEAARGAMSLRTVFRRPEDGVLFRVWTPFTHGPARVERADPASLDDDDLPDEGVALDGVDEVQTPLFSQEDLVRQSRQRGRDMVNLKTRVRNHVKEAPAEDVGHLLLAFQGFLDAAGQATLGRATSRGVIPLDIQKQTRVDVVDTVRGSFGIVLAGPPDVSLFGSQTFQAAVQEFAKLIQAGQVEDTLKGHLERLQRRAAGSYARVLKTVVSSSQGLAMEWSFPSTGNTGSVQLGLADAAAAMTVIREFEEQAPEVYDVTGRLDGMSIRKKTYELHVESDGKVERFSGRVDDDALPSAEPTLNVMYDATIRETIHRNSTTGAEKRRFRLMRLTPVGDDDDDEASFWVGVHQESAGEEPGEVQ